MAFLIGVQQNMSSPDSMTKDEAAASVQAAIDEMGAVPNLPGPLGEEALELLQAMESFYEKLTSE